MDFDFLAGLVCSIKLLHISLMLLLTLLGLRIREVILLLVLLFLLGVVADQEPSVATVS